MIYPNECQNLLTLVFCAVSYWSAVIQIDEMEVTHDDLVQAGITQQYNRYCRDGTDCVCGIFRCEFEPLQRRFALHVPIHPPMKNLPEVEAIGIDCDLRTRVTDCQKFGVRIEVVLSEVATTQHFNFLDVVISSTTE